MPTKVTTVDGIELIIPNAQLARSTIFNHSRPTRVFRRTVHVTVPYEIPARRVHDVILKATAQLSGVRSSPPLSIVTSGFLDSGAQYAVQYFIDSVERREALDGTVRDRISSALARASIPISANIHAAAPARPAPDADSNADDGDAALAERVAAIRGIDFLRDLPQDAVRALAQEARTLSYEPGEIIVSQGERSEDLYVCSSGELAVLYTARGGPAREVVRLRSGSLFGELAYMNGEPRSATVQAVSSCELVVIGKAPFSRLLRSVPSLAERITERMAEHSAELEVFERDITPEEKRQSVTRHKTSLLERLRDFLSS